MKIAAACETYKLFSSSQSQLRNGFSRTAATQTQPNSNEVIPFKDMPGLSSLPFIGSMHHFLPFFGEIGPDGQLFDKLGNFRKKYGDIVKMGGILNRPHFVFLFKPEDFDQVYRAEETNPLRPGFETLSYYRDELRHSVYAGVQGLTTAQGPVWRDVRTKVNPAMLKPKLIKLYAPGLDEIAQEMVERIKMLQNRGDYLRLNFELEITKWSLESVALVGLGARLGCLRDDLSEDHPARQLMKCAREVMDLTFILEIMPSLWKLYPTKNYKKLIATFDKQWEISSAYLNEAKQKIKDRGHDIPEEDKSIVEKLLAIDEKVAVMMSNDMLFAGIDTVAFTTISLLYRLAINPQTQQKLREEIRAGDSSRYLKACLKESLRIWHVVPANLRRTSKEHVVGGYQIPKGVDVIAPNQYLSNLDEYYPRANEFLPERWLVEKTDPLYYGNAHPMVTLPFGFGVRSCIGRRIAELEMELFVKNMINTFNVTWEGPPIKLVTKLLNSFGKEMHFKFESIK